MHEIGSEFWDVPQAEKESGIFPKTTKWFLSGRSALQAILAELKDCRTVAMPAWCCESMVKPFVDAGIQVRFYQVCCDERPEQAIRLDCDALFLMDYFGYTGKRPDLRGYNGVVIRDVTHSIFSASCSDADYYFGSLRKWCGVWTGGYAWTRDGLVLSIAPKSDDCGYTELRKKAMQLKGAYIDHQELSDKSYLDIFAQAEDLLEDIGVVSAADRDVSAALKLDVQFIKSQRRKNAEILRSAFPDWLIFREMQDADCPMFVPILVPNGKRNELRQHLIREGIFCPVHWPVSTYHKPDGKTETLYANELSLVCDQRYSEEDMDRMVQAIKAFWKEG